MQMTTWLVGPEYDETIFKRLGNALSSMGFKTSDHWEGLAGSQEIQNWKFICNSGELTVEAETYVGLSVKGSPELVQQVRECYASFTT
jgi:hypothetical protein